MKKIVAICLILGVISCKSQEKKVPIIENVNVEQFQKMIAIQGVQLVDVRTLKEFKNGHIKNAQLINFFDNSFKEVSTKRLDKNQAVYLYCRSGGRSAKAAKIYKEAGFKKMYNLIGGFNAWKAKNLKIEN